MILSSLGLRLGFDVPTGGLVSVVGELSVEAIGDSVGTCDGFLTASNRCNGGDGVTDLDSSKRAYLFNNTREER